MYVSWRRRRVKGRGPEWAAGARADPMAACPHAADAERLALIPVVLRCVRRDGKPRQQLVARLPSIRTCCVADPRVRAAWWEVIERTLAWWGQCRGSDCEVAGFDARAAAAIRARLAATVPPPTDAERWACRAERARREAEADARREGLRASFGSRGGGPHGAGHAVPPFRERLARDFAAAAPDPFPWGYDSGRRFLGFLRAQHAAARLEGVPGPDFARWALGLADEVIARAETDPVLRDIARLGFQVLLTEATDPAGARAAAGQAGGWSAPGPGVAAPLADALRELGLSWPCTAEQARRAYRETAKQTHPDAGGTAAAFRRAHEAYRTIRPYVEGRAG